MTLRNTSIAVATVIAALAGASTFDSVSARSGVAGRNTSVTLDASFVGARAPNQSQPGATSHLPNRDMRGAPDKGGRGMHGGGRGRMNGGMGRR